MKCFECEKRKAKDKYGVYCSKECREKAIKKTQRRHEQYKKRRLKSEMKKFEEYLKSGRRTY